MLLRPTTADLQDLREVAGKVQLDASAIRLRRHDDVCDHRADEVHRFNPEFGVGQVLLEFPDLA